MAQAIFPSQAADTETFNLRDAFETIVSQWRIVCAVAGTILIAALAYALIASPTFQADTLVQVEEKKGSAPVGLQQIATALDVSQSPVAGEVEILKSREVIGKAVEALHLDIAIEVDRRVPYFFSRAESSKSTELRPPLFGSSAWAWGGEQLQIDELSVPDLDIGHKFRLEVLPGGDWSLSDEDAGQIAIGKIGAPQTLKLPHGDGRIWVHAIQARPGETFSVSKRSPIGTYEGILHRIKVAETARQSSVLRMTCESSDRIDAVAICNEITKAYLVQNVERRSEEAERSLVFLSDQLPQLQKEVERSEQAFNQYRLSRQSVNLDKESEALLNRSVDLEKQRLEAQMRGQLLAERFQPSHPDVQALNSQIGEIRSAEADVSKEVQKLPSTEQEYLRLQRDVKVNTDLYISLLNNAQQLRIAKAGTIGNVRVIDFATAADKPVRPQRAAIVAFGLTGGILIGLAVAFGRRALRPTLRHAEEVERIASAPVYATVPDSALQRKILFGTPKFRKQEALLHSLSPEDPAIEALRGMRMGLQFAMVDARNRNVLITGPTSGIGKTFVSANLSAVLASAGKRVLLIDCDLRRPRVGDYFRLSRSPGLSELLVGNGQTPSQVIHPVSENLHVICSGVVPPNPSELLSRKDFGDLLESFQSSYDYIILDTPPLLPVGDTLALGRYASVVFLLLRSDVSTVIEVNDSLRKIDSAGLKVSGIIFNGVRQSRFGYGYSYHYQYSSYRS